MPDLPEPFCSSSVTFTVLVTASATAAAAAAVAATAAGRGQADEHHSEYESQFHSIPSMASASSDDRNGRPRTRL